MAYTNKIRKGIRAFVWLIVLVILLCCVYGFLIEPNRLVVHQETIVIDNWPR